MKNALSRLPAPLVLLTLLACDPADDVKVQPLPSLESSSPEARAGVPEVRGAWRFAGWELAPDDTTGLEAPLPGFGILWLQTQKRDSLGGSYVVPGGRTPLIGEVRRDSVVSLVALLGPGNGRFLTGSLQRDTLWVELTSLFEPGTWRPSSRAAFVRSQLAAAPFARLRGALPPPPAPDTLAGADSLQAPIATPTATPPTGAQAATPGAPTRTNPPAGAGQPAAAPAARAQPTTPPVQQAPPPARQTPAPSPPARQTPPPARQPAPTPAPREPEERPNLPPLLGEPVDTTGGQ